MQSEGVELIDCQDSQRISSDRQFTKSPLPIHVRSAEETDAARVRPYGAPAVRGTYQNSSKSSGITIGDHRCARACAGACAVLYAELLNLRQANII